MPALVPGAAEHWRVGFPAPSFCEQIDAGLLEGQSEKQGLLRMSPFAGDTRPFGLQRLQRQIKISVNAGLKCVKCQDPLSFLTSTDPKGIFFFKSEWYLTDVDIYPTRNEDWERYLIIYFKIAMQILCMFM